MTEPTLTNRPKLPKASARTIYNLSVLMNHYEQWFKGFTKKIRDLVEGAKVCDGCPFISRCENVPYDCNAFDALKELMGKETKQ